MTGTGLKTSFLVFQLCLWTPHSFFHNENVIDREAWQASVHGIAESDMTEWLSFTYYKKQMKIEHFLKFSALCYGIKGYILAGGEGDGNPLQYSCLENPVDWGAWWTAVHRVAQSWARLKQLCMHACIGEGNSNPLQCSCLENPVDRGAWRAAVYGVAQSRTRLKWLNSSSSIPSGTLLRTWRRKQHHCSCRISFLIRI